jgi:glycosyltransferase involved in cell wall biosynthesis
MRVMQAEIGGGVPRLDGRGDCDAVRVLIRLHGRPVDWLAFWNEGEVVDPAMIRREMLKQRPFLWPAVMGRLMGEADLVCPPISIIVCTRDRHEELAGCLDSLQALDYPHYQVIVVDNASRTDDTRRVAEEHGVLYVREDRPGLDNARNRGIREAGHDIIAFTDDDVRVDSDWLHALAGTFADPDIAAVTGFVAPALLDTEARQLFELVYGGMGKGTWPRTWEGSRLDDRSRVLSHHVGVGANMAFRRELLFSLDGFDPALDVGTPSHGGGDIDMFHRVLVAGRTIRYEPRAIVWHRHRADLEALHRQLFDNGRAYGVHLLRRLREAHVSRFATLRVAAGWAWWQIGRILSRFRHRERMPLHLILAEVAGALTSPIAYTKTYRAARGVPRLGAEPMGS